jgi:hemerythrin-like domain-containing protein
VTYVIEILRQEHRNIEKLLRVLERELNVFDRGERPDYEVVLAVIDYFKDYPDICHHPKEDLKVSRSVTLAQRRPSVISKPSTRRAQGVCAASRRWWKLS